MVINLSGAIDNIPPTVISTVPANNAINFPANSAIGRHVQRAGDQRHVDQLLRDCRYRYSGLPVTATVALDAANKNFTLTPSAALTPNTTYTAAIVGGTGAVTDIAGNPMAARLHLQFHNNGERNRIPPAVISTNPVTASTGFKVSDPITVTFNEAIQVNPLTMTATTFFLSEGVTGTVTYDPATRTATFKPD